MPSKTYDKNIDNALIDAIKFHLEQANKLEFNISRKAVPIAGRYGIAGYTPGTGVTIVIKVNGGS